MRLHITGASGSGTTTLGAAISQRLEFRHLDADDFYWLPTDPPFTQKRELSARVALLAQEFFKQEHVVLSGSISSWGHAIEDAFDLIVFLYLPASIRIERLRRREIEKFGFADPKFLEWASQYDDGPSEGRSLAKHNAWLAGRRCPVLRLETNLTVEERLSRVLHALSQRRAASAV